MNHICMRTHKYIDLEKKTGICFIYQDKDGLREMGEWNRNTLSFMQRRKMVLIGTEIRDLLFLR